MSRGVITIFLLLFMAATASVAYLARVKLYYSQRYEQSSSVKKLNETEPKDICINNRSDRSVTCVFREATNSSERDFLVQEEISTWTFGMLIVSIFGSVSGLLGLYWIRETLVAARTANKIGQEALFANERPWIFTEVEPVGDIDVSKDDICHLEIKLNNKNYGKTIALRAHSNVTSCPFGMEKDTIIRLCEESKGTGIDDGVLIAPGEVFTRKWIWSYNPGDWVGNMPLSGGIAKMIVGCVTYESPLSGALHQTAFVYTVVESDGGVELIRWSGSFAN